MQPDILAQKREIKRVNINISIYANYFNNIILSYFIFYYKFNYIKQF